MAERFIPRRFWRELDCACRYRAVVSRSPPPADGTKLVAGLNNGQIYTSTDSGANWTAGPVSGQWYSIAASSDGTKLVAVSLNGQIYTSTTSGVTWTARDSARQWYSVASSSDGTKLVAVVYGGQIYTSTNSGQSWTPRDSDRYWYRSRLVGGRHQTGRGGLGRPDFHLHRFGRNLGTARTVPSNGTQSPHPAMAPN